MVWQDALQGTKIMLKFNKPFLILEKYLCRQYSSTEIYLSNNRQGKKKKKKTLDGAFVTQRSNN